MASDPSDLTYECSLPAEMQSKSQAELGEDPKERLNAVRALRQWILDQPHITYRTEIEHLLLFLRGAKFSQLRAREMIEGNLMMKVKAPEWFTDIDTRAKGLAEIIRRGYCIPLPGRDKDGSQIILYRLGVLDASSKKMPVDDEIRAGMILGMHTGQSEMTQVNGSVYVFDFTGITAKHITRWKVDDMRKWMRIWQKNVPGRFKAFHYYNAGTFFEAMMAMARPFMGKKYQDRIKVHTNLESLYRHIDMNLLPADYLPDDYDGPHAGDLADITKRYHQTVSADEFRNKVLEMSSNKYGIDENKKVKVAQESFRKLNVD